MLRPQNRPVYAKFDANYRGFCTWKAKKQKVRFSTKSTDTQWIMTNFVEFRSRNNKAGGPHGGPERRKQWRVKA